MIIHGLPAFCINKDIFGADVFTLQKAIYKNILL